jgi:hypothetical protein
MGDLLNPSNPIGLTNPMSPNYMLDDDMDSQPVSGGGSQPVDIPWPDSLGEWLIFGGVAAAVVGLLGYGLYWFLRNA